MTKIIVRKNERSWAIEIITLINSIASQNGLLIKRAGGEEVRANLLRGRSSAKPEAHESLAHG
jgi:hypothetical protein